MTALVDSKETRTVNFQLLYNVKDAGWYPTYDVRVTDVGSPLNILMTANVFQRSGETWKNIPIQLSTGSPKENATRHSSIPRGTTGASRARSPPPQQSSRCPRGRRHPRHIGA